MQPLVCVGCRSFKLSESEPTQTNSLLYNSSFISSLLIATAACAPSEAATITN